MATASSDANPTFSYTAAGTYDVTLQITNSSGANSTTRVGYMMVTNAVTAPAAAFTSDVEAGTAPLTVQFSDDSTGSGPLTYAWDFDNDGIIDSTIQNPSFTFATAGTYTVNLTVTNSPGSDAVLKTSFITVNPAPVAPVADFSSDVVTGNAPLTVQFSDDSTGSGPLTYAWDFDNDGTIDSTIQNPSFTFATAGTYTVNLTVTNSPGSDAELKTSFITVNPAPVAPVAAFTSDVEAGTAPLTVQFSDDSTGSGPLTYAWDFDNDGTIDSTIQNPSFTFATTGTYTVNLTVTNSAGSDAELKTSFITVNPAPVAPVAAFTSDVEAGTAPLPVQFSDESTGSGPLTYAWDFDNDGTIDSTIQNPSFTYVTAGTYTVKLSVTGPGGSDTKVKLDVITVSTASPALTPITILAKCPVDISVTDPEGHTINKQMNEIPGAIYSEPTVDTDGLSDPQILIPEKKPGNYIITVIPKPGVSLSKTFTLQIESDGAVLTLADNVPVVSAITSEPYKILVKADGGIIIIGDGTIPTPEFPDPAFPVIVIGTMAVVACVYQRKQ